MGVHISGIIVDLFGGKKENNEGDDASSKVNQVPLIQADFDLCTQNS